MVSVHRLPSAVPHFVRCAIHIRLQMLAWAVRLAQLAVREYLRQRHLVQSSREADQPAQRYQLRGSRRLNFKIAQHDDAEVVLVVPLHVGTLIRQRSSLPDPPGAIHNEVIGNVRPMAIACTLSGVEDANAFEFASGLSPCVSFQIAGGVMHGDSRDAVHGLNLCKIGMSFGPIRARNDEHRGVRSASDGVSVRVGEQCGAQVRRWRHACCWR